MTVAPIQFVPSADRLRIAVLTTPAVFVIALVLLFLRRPEMLLQAELWADDGLFYQQALWFGPATVAMSYAGYLAFAQRIVGLAEVAVPPIYGPLVANLSVLLITAMVAAFIASDRLASVIPDRRLRVTLALLFVSLPAGHLMLGTMANVQWIIGVYLVAMLVATLPTSRTGRVGDAIGIVVAGLSGAIGILLLPLYAIRAWRDHSFGWHLLWLGLTAAIQVIVYLVSFRFPPAWTDWSLVPEVLLLRFLVGLIGIYGPLSVPLALAALAAVLVAVWRLPRAWRLGALYIALVIPLAGIRATQQPTANLLDPLVDERYFYLGGVVIAGLVVIAAARGRWLALPAIALLTAGVLIDFRLPVIPSAGWAQTASCIRVSPCVVPVAPGSHWAIHWP